MKKYVLLSLVASFTFSLNGCSSDEDSSSGSLVNKMKFVGENWNNDFENHTINFEYDGDKLVRYSDGTGLRTEFSYTNDLITHVEKFERINQQSELFLKADFFYDSSGRLEKFEINTGYDPYLGVTVEFTYVDQQNATFIYVSDYENYNGSIIFDENNVSKLIKNDYTLFGPNDSLYDVEYTMTYDTNKHIFSEVVGFDNLKLYNIFYSLNDDFYDMEGLGIYSGGKNNLLFKVVQYYNNGNLSGGGGGSMFSRYFQYGNNGFPKEISKYAESSQKMLFYY